MTKKKASRKKGGIKEPDIFPESDDFTLGTHPRKKLGLVGHQKTAEILTHSFTSGRPPQVILLTGPQGIGKATLTYHFIRAFERHGQNMTVDDIYTQPEDDIYRHIAHLGTGNLKILRRGFNEKTGKFYSAIRMDDVKALKSFFTLAAHNDGYRYCVIDSVDDMVHGADSVPNALLKTLEEPPAKTIFFLLAHNEGSILPTIRSRASHYKLCPPTETELGHIMQDISSFRQLDTDRQAKVLSEAAGSVRRVLALTEPIWIDLSKSVKTVLLRSVAAERVINIRKMREKFFDGTEASLLLQLMHMIFCQAIVAFMRHTVKNSPRSQHIFYQTELFDKFNGLFIMADEYNIAPAETFETALHLIRYYQYQTSHLK
ncbi:MAG: hypothetical protein AAF621_03490 [Pseudomonadota bacterium]